jgi:hypothetical protein
MAQNNDDPWWPIGLGSMIALLGILVIVLAETTDAPEYGYWLGVAAAAIGGIVMQVGLIALGVAIGIRSAKD